MAFNDLSTLTQNIIMVNFEFFGKLVLICGFMFLCILYLYKFRNMGKTPYLMVSVIRVIFFCFSVVYLFFSPLYILLLYPIYSLENIINYLFIFMYILVIIIGIFLLVNLYYYSPIYMLKKAGFDLESKGQNKVLNKIDRFLGFKK